ncbi:hypothetical protein BCR39DRAFT_560295 [Naematelia encephala]|uniref:Structure-specific endonuclease subunit SLX4 n=1 Tax=Naematelia encephala TaxID=71784 RepID=A0A1Y2AWN3_9TREE|nr:hypothetical protein BCR39DRAFT_560295 [Naematelia encephala]
MSSPDEPIAIDPPPDLSKAKKPRGRPTSAVKAMKATKPSITADVIAPEARSLSRPRSRKTKSPSLDASPVVASKGKERAIDVDAYDEDEPVFLGQALAAKLADKYSFRSPSVGSSTSIAKNSKAETPQPPPLPIAAPLSPPLEPVPVPPWLGKTAVLLQLPRCVVCKVRWKKNQSGAARWRHISTCLPPLFRPPNPPPDLQSLINDALLNVAGPSSSTSLLDLHVNSMETSPEAPDLGKKSKGKASTTPAGLRRMTSVKAAEQRGETWHEEVDERVGKLFGKSPKKASPSPSQSQRPRQISPPISPVSAFQSTQPLGRSELAAIYTRQAESSLSPSGSPEDLRSPAHPDADASMDEIPMPPPSQSRQVDDELEVEDGLQNQDERDPFRQGGGPYADGDLSWRWGSARKWGHGWNGEPNDDESSERINDGTPPRQRSGLFTIHRSPVDDSPLRSEVAHSPTATARLSITPRETKKRSRKSLSPTPTPTSFDLSISTIRPPDQDDEEDWGNDALLSWSGGNEDDVASLDGVESVSSVAPEDAGVSEGEEWGKEAVLNWEYSSEEEGSSTSDVVGSDHDVKRESVEQLLSRGMPNYDSWTDRKLKKLTEGYGYRPINKHEALVKVAIDCWRAINPQPQPQLRQRSPSETSSISSIEVPLASARKPTSKSPAKPKTKVKSTEGVPPSPSTKAKGKRRAKSRSSDPQTQDEPERPLDEQFYEMIRNDHELWIRILRYEPISMDELISKAIQTGIKGVKWKERLRRFLDLQGIIHFVDDPTGARRRR